MTDNGAKALAERLHDTAVRNHNLGEGPLRAICDHPESHEPRADAILANGAVFLTAEEAERLRRIEVATKEFTDAVDSIRGGVLAVLTDAEWEAIWTTRTALRAALTEPSHD